MYVRKYTDDGWYQSNPKPPAHVYPPPKDQDKFVIKRPKWDTWDESSIAPEEDVDMLGADPDNYFRMPRRPRGPDDSTSSSSSSAPTHEENFHFRFAFLGPQKLTWTQDRYLIGKGLAFNGSIVTNTEGPTRWAIDVLADRKMTFQPAQDFKANITEFNILSSVSQVLRYYPRGPPLRLYVAIIGTIVFDFKGYPSPDYTCKDMRLAKSGVITWIGAEHCKRLTTEDTNPVREAAGDVRDMDQLTCTCSPGQLIFRPAGIGGYVYFSVEPHLKTEKGKEKMSLRKRKLLEERAKAKREGRLRPKRGKGSNMQGTDEDEVFTVGERLGASSQDQHSDGIGRGESMQEQDSVGCMSGSEDQDGWTNMDQCQNYDDDEEDLLNARVTFGWWSILAVAVFSGGLGISLARRRRFPRFQDAAVVFV